MLAIIRVYKCFRPSWLRKNCSARDIISNVAPGDEIKKSYVSSLLCTGGEFQCRTEIQCLLWQPGDCRLLLVMQVMTIFRMILLQEEFTRAMRLLQEPGGSRTLFRSLQAQLLLSEEKVCASIIDFSCSAGETHLQHAKDHFRALLEGIEAVAGVWTHSKDFSAVFPLNRQ